jgi:DnaJ-class molecular chaperone
MYDGLSIDEILAMDLPKTNNKPSTVTKKLPCPKCRGRKTLEQYKHVKGGKCFECGGKGFKYMNMDV